jgi:hypothetical protein
MRRWPFRTDRYRGSANMIGVFTHLSRIPRYVRGRITIIDRRGLESASWRLLSSHHQGIRCPALPGSENASATSTKLDGSRARKICLIPRRLAKRILVLAAILRSADASWCGADPEPAYYRRKCIGAGAPDKVLHATNMLSKVALFGQNRWTDCNETNNFQCCHTLIRVLPDKRTFPHSTRPV